MTQQQYEMPITQLTYHQELSEQQRTTIREAIDILESRIRNPQAFASPDAVRDFCRLHLATERDEQFCCLFLDSKHRLIVFERLFTGTVDGASVYPRVVVRRALELNAAAVIFAHNHPSGQPEPSQADIRITENLKSSLALVDVRVVDHLVVALEGSISFAERGLI